MLLFLALACNRPDTPKVTEALPHQPEAEAKGPPPQALPKPPPPPPPPKGTIKVTIKTTKAVKDTVVSAEGCTEGPAGVVVVGEAGLVEGAAAYVDEVAFKPNVARLEVKDCRLSQRLAVLPERSGVSLRNTDKISHHWAAAGSEPREIKPGATAGIPYEAASRVSMGCADHPWEQLTIIQASHGAISDATGVATIEDVPPGHRTVIVHHPELGDGTADVEVLSGQTAEVSVTIPAAQPVP